MKLINISEQNLEELREISIANKCTIPYLVFAECNNDRCILILVEVGKYKDYFTHVEIMFNGNIKKMKLLLEYKKEELQYEILKDMCETTDKNFRDLLCLMNIQDKHK